MSGPWINGPLVDPGAIGITGGSIAGVSGVPVKLAQWGVPAGIAPSGTMANNGAVTFGTALNTTYGNGIWLMYPAGAIAAGVPAAAQMLWTVMSSTTVGQVYNSTFDGLSVPVAGSTATPFATTGPGAFTGVTAVMTVATIPVAANALGPTGAIVGDWNVDSNTAAGNKSIALFYSTTGGTDYVATTLSTQGQAAWHTAIRNQSTGAQSGGTMGASAGSGFGAGTKYGSADTTAATTLVFRFTNATATNFVILAGGNFTTIQ